MFPTQQSSTGEQAGAMTGAAMRDALASGSAKVLSPSIPEYARLNGSWWLDAGEDSWVLVTDSDFTEKLDASAEAMTAATAATQRRRAARGLFRDARPEHDHETRN